MNELQIFNSGEFGEIRTIEIDGKPYFVGTDVAKALGYNNPRDAVSRLTSSFPAAKATGAKLSRKSRQTAERNVTTSFYRRSEPV